VKAVQQGRVFQGLNMSGRFLKTFIVGLHKSAYAPFPFIPETFANNIEAIIYHTGSLAISTNCALDIAIIQNLLTDHSAHNFVINKSFEHLNDACKPLLSTQAILTFVISL